MIIDRKGLIAHWEIEFDCHRCIAVVEDGLKNAPPVDLSVTPDVTQVDPGDLIGYTLNLTNRSKEMQNVICTLDQVLPDSSRVTRWGPAPFSLQAGETFAVHLEELIPLGSPMGSHSFRIKMGTVEEGVWEVDGFGFKVN